jgi:hypothetical protein
MKLGIGILEESRFLLSDESIAGTRHCRGCEHPRLWERHVVRNIFSPAGAQWGAGRPDEPIWGRSRRAGGWRSSEIGIVGMQTGGLSPTDDCADFAAVATARAA